MKESEKNRKVNLCLLFKRQRSRKTFEPTLQLTCLASTSRVMKKMKREMQPMDFRSFRTPGLKGQRATGKWRERKQEGDGKGQKADKRGRDRGEKRERERQRCGTKNISLEIQIVIRSLRLALRDWFAQLCSR